MSHPEQLEFFRAVAEANQDTLAGADLLEIGSYDVNGSVRSVFAGVRSYCGVDLTEGPGVDLVSYGHLVDLPDDSLDVCISSECFEHDPHWIQTFLNMVRLTRPGGLVAFTCASRGRLEHGTRRTGAECSPGTQFEGLDYYRNLTPADFELLPLDQLFSDHKFWVEPRHCDLYFVGVKAGASPQTSGRIPSLDMSRIQSQGQARAARRLAEAPMLMISRVVSDRTYQEIAVRYWATARKLAARS